MTGFREPLDLSDIARQYEVFKTGTSAAGVNYVRERTEREVDEARASIPRRLYEPPVRAGSGDEPALVGAGPRCCSTSRQIAPGRPWFAWDPNRYYRDLGIAWPYVGATRKDLRIGYLDRGGQDSRRLTYCLKQLLDPVVRAEYDAMPLGEQYLNDEYVQEAFKQRAADEAQARNLRGEYTTARDVLDDWGYKIVPLMDEEDIDDSIDTKEPERQDQFLHEETVGDHWQYAFYLWRTTRWDNTRLSAWQSALITELAGMSPAAPTLVVGLMGRQPHRYVVGEVDGDPVVFLNRDEEVTPDLARAAATALHEQVTTRSTPRHTALMRAGKKMSEPMHFRKGGEAAQEAAKTSGGLFARVHYLKVEDDSQVTLRYLTDSPDWIYVDQHASVPTKNKPEDWPKEQNWPTTMPAVCRYDEAFGGFYKDCYIDDAGLTNQWGRLCKPTVRVWALAVLREEVIGTKEMAEAEEIEADQVGMRLGYRDQTREIAERDADGKETGKTTKEPAIVVVNMAPSNYFNGLQSLFSIYHSITLCDYVVKKAGTKKDSVYNHIPLPDTPNLHGAYVIKDKSGQVVQSIPATDRWEEKYPPAIKAQNLDLEAIIADKASDDYYARFFDVNKTPAPREGDKSATTSAPDVPDAPADGVDADKLAAMRQRVRGHATASVGDID